MATPETKPPLRAVGAPAGKRVEVPIKKATGPGDDKIQGGAGTNRCDGGSGHDTAAGCETTSSIP